MLSRTQGNITMAPQHFLCFPFSCTDSPDFIVVRDGVDASGPVIAQYCNTRNGEVITSSGDNLYIEFIVDERKQRQGFAATFQYIKEERDFIHNGFSSPDPTSKTIYPGRCSISCTYLCVRVCMWVCSCDVRCCVIICILFSEGCFVTGSSPKSFACGASWVT